MSDWRDEREAEFERSQEQRERRREEKRIREQQRERLVRLVAIGVVCGIALIVLISLLKPHGGASPSAQTQQTEPSGQTSNSYTPGTDGGSGDGGLSDEAKARIAEVSERASANCTGAQPSDLTDPDTYNERGKHIMQWIADTYADDPDFDNADSLSYATHYASDGSVAPYLIAVNRAQNTVTVYVLDGDGNYTVPYQAFVCSTGDATPIGYYTTPGSSSWGYLYGDVYGQYVTRITGDILFHSVPYYSQHQDDLEYQQYNKLGTSASLGCIRLQVCDTKWIYDNCPAGTPVIIYDDKVPGPLGKPGTIRVDETDDDVRSETYRGFDPTDPNAENPWDEQYRSGTAIRTNVAQREWEQAQDRGTWSATVNATDLQGHSTDASTAGNPG
ncbi:MAG: L,D-transpeptidase [Olegusella sp.]|nr:L,D-transpeptidase [Olegusella sp.]